MKIIFRIKRSHLQKGQSLVEVAITFTLILMLIAGAFDFGNAYMQYIALRDAAQEGATFGSVYPGNEGAIINRIKTSSSTPIRFESDPNFETPQITFTGQTCAGGVITVTLVYNYQIVMPLIGSIIGRQTIPLTARVTNTILLPELCP
jgi:hypothetical protein